LEVLNSSIDSEETLKDITIFIRNEVIRDEESIKLAVELGLTPKLTSLLECPSNDIKLEIIPSIEAIFSKLKDTNEELLSLIDKFTNICSSTETTTQLKEQALLALANIISNSAKAKTKLINTNILQSIEHIVKNKYQPIEIIRACSILISELPSNSSTPIVLILIMIGEKMW